MTKRATVFTIFIFCCLGVFAQQQLIGFNKNMHNYVFRFGSDLFGFSLSQAGTRANGDSMIFFKNKFDEDASAFTLHTTEDWKINPVITIEQNGTNFGFKNGESIFFLSTDLKTQYKLPIGTYSPFTMILIFPKDSGFDITGSFKMKFSSKASNQISTEDQEAIDKAKKESGGATPYYQSTWQDIIEFEHNFDKDKAPSEVTIIQINRQ